MRAIGITTVVGARAAHLAAAVVVVLMISLSFFPGLQAERCLVLQLRCLTMAAQPQQEYTGESGNKHLRGTRAATSAGVVLSLKYMFRQTALHRILRRRPGCSNATSRVNGTGEQWHKEP